MTGIPCSHAYAAVKIVHGNIYDYVDNCYKKSSQEKIYAPSMILVVITDMPRPNDYYRIENVSEQVFLLPPITSRPPRRPKVNRDESQFQNKRIYQCGRCHQPRHTSRNCRNPNQS
ncbi:uncharacterized protein LOC114754446 [Neltuma alba]|uniref:uncharacterized protein LOC114754446 n=1 Tax=Neltuma alba TaxID=207710 RepID=UPI0010A48DE9|nr:uncharacterized protein LOC114754446 [Prosopis alba]